MKRAIDFLAGARLAGEQHGRLGLRHARRLRQHVLPLARMADDAAMPGPRLELARQRGHLRLEPRRRLARLGVAPRRFGQPLMRQRQRQVIRHAPREVDVVVGERFRLPRQEEERAEDVAAERHRHAQRRPHAERPNSGRARCRARSRVATSWTTYELAVEQRAVLAGQDRRRPERRVVDLGARQRVDAERAAVLAPTTSAPACRAAARRGRRRRLR